MLDLLVLRERLRAFYAKYEIIITPVVKFLITLSTLILINSNAGYSEKLSTPVIYSGGFYMLGTAVRSYKHIACRIHPF